MYTVPHRGHRGPQRNKTPYVVSGCPLVTAIWWTNPAGQTTIAEKEKEGRTWNWQKN